MTTPIWDRDRCKERHRPLYWMLGVVLVLFGGMVGLSLYAAQAASEAKQAAAEATAAQRSADARWDEFKQRVLASLERIEAELREDRKAKP